MYHGCEFITSPNTFVATSNAGLFLGAKPVFVDVEGDTGNIDTSKIEDSISNVTKFLVPVHFAGQPVDMEQIADIAEKHGLFVVEDACHALGASFLRERIGSCKYSQITVLSFHPVKHITSGEGGAALTNNRAIYEKLLMFRSHGITRKNFQCEPDGDWYYEMQDLGYNYRMNDLQASLGASQLAKSDFFLQRRIKIAARYREAFSDNRYFDTPVEKDGMTSSWHLFPVRLKPPICRKKKELFCTLRAQGLGVQVHYKPVYQQPYYQRLGYSKDLCPVAEKFYQRELSLPIYPAMTRSDENHVIETLLGALKKLYPC
jgi:dTDP-4-amino-4,6-dideoxygalactose transaminase